MRKSICLMALCLILLLSACGESGSSSAVPSATENNTAFQSEEHAYVDYQGGLMLVSCGSRYRADSTLTVPAEHQGKAVVAVGKNAFNGCQMSAVELPDSIQLIDGGAFKNCTQLERVSFGSGVTEIAGEVFMNCTSLTEITIPETVTEIRGNCFQGCTALKKVKLHNYITSIHGYAFAGCSAL